LTVVLEILIRTDPDAWARTSPNRSFRARFAAENGTGRFLGPGAEVARCGGNRRVVLFPDEVRRPSGARPVVESWKDLRMRHALALIRLALMVLFSLLSVPIAILIGLAGAATGRAGRTRALRILPHLTSFWSRVNLVFMGVKIATPEPRPARAGLLTSNHLSYLDILVVASLFPSRFVAKKEIAAWPFIGLLTRSVGTLFMERGRSREVPRIGAEIRKTLDAGISVVFFPEGRISDGQTVQAYHGGLLETAVRESIECLPLCLHYEMADPSVSPAETVCWAGQESFLTHFWRMLRHDRIVARVRWSPAPLTDTDRKRLAERLHAETMKMFEPVRRRDAGGATA